MGGTRIPLPLHSTAPCTTFRPASATHLALLRFRAQRRLPLPLQAQAVRGIHRGKPLGGQAGHLQRSINRAIHQTIAQVSHTHAG